MAPFPICHSEAAAEAADLINITLCRVITLTLMTFAREAADGAKPESGEQGSLWGSRG